MRKRINWDKVFSFTSWLLVFFLAYGATVLWIFPPSGDGPIAGLVGILNAQIFYSTLYLTEAALLGYAKWKKKNRMRKNVLLLIYLTGFFTTLLGAILGGVPAMISPKLIGNFVLSMAAAFCWLHWTFRHEYMTQEEFNEFQQEAVDGCGPQDT